MDSGTSVKVAVRIRPLSSDEAQEDETLCINMIPGEPQVGPGMGSILIEPYIL